MADKTKPQRVEFDFKFSEEERKETGITERELMAMLSYDDINTVQAPTKEYTDTVITEKGTTAHGPSRTRTVRYLSRLKGTIEKPQLSALKSLFRKK